MGTEIGARIFSDVQRYNQLPNVAKVMGLDTSSDRTLWRDRALVELNVAVLYSFEKAGVNVRVILDAAEESSNAAAFAMTSFLSWSSRASSPRSL